MRHPIAQKLDAYVVYLLMRGASALFFATIFTVNLVYHKEVVGLNPLQLVLIGTALETVAFLFEIPTGVVADVYSRRASVIVGLFLIGLGFVLEGSTPRFEAILLAQLFWGVGATFTSGATEAWIADEVGQERAGHAFLRGSQVGQFCGLLGIGLSVTLASVHLALPVLLGGLLFVALSLFLLFVMSEDGFIPTPVGERTTWQQMFHTVREGIGLVRLRPVLITILSVSAMHGLFSEGFDRLWRAHLLDNFTLPALGQLNPVVWFGIIDAIAMLLAMATTEVARRRIDLTHQTAMTRGLAVIYGLMVIGIVVFGLAGSFTLALTAYWVASALRATSGPIFTAWLNQHIDSGVRATVISMAAQLNAIGQIGGGPVVGAIGTAFSLRAALVTSGLVLSPVLALLARATRQSQATPELPQVEVA